MGNYLTSKLSATVLGGTVEKILYDKVEEGAEFVGMLVRHSNGASYAVWFMSDDKGNAPGAPQITDATPARTLRLNIPHTLDKEGNQI